MAARLAEALKLRDALRKYSPISSDGAEHEEMGNLAAQFLQMTVVRERELRTISVTNLAAQARDVKRVVGKLKAHAKKVDETAGTDSFDAIQRIFNAAGEQIREVQMVSLDENPLVKPDYDTLMSKTRQLASTVAAMGTWVDEDPHWGIEDLAQTGQRARRGQRRRQHRPDPAAEGRAAGAGRGQEGCQRQDGGDEDVAGRDHEHRPAPEPETRPGLALYLRRVEERRRGLEGLNGPAPLRWRSSAWAPTVRSRRQNRL
jgi:hypothetical protein